MINIIEDIVKIMKYEKWINENCSRLDGKTVCITGSTGGLGTVVANELAYLGANLILANRNKKKSEKQKEELLRLYPTIEIKILSFPACLTPP